MSNNSGTNKRNLTIGVVAHVDAGKTTLTEAMLYKTGQIRAIGRVDHGDTHLDTNLVERERGITIFSKQARMELPDVTVTLLDTPGHTDFSAETERTLQVLDAAVLVISGTDGVQGHTRTLWRLLAHYKVPVLLFVNKMDLAGADRNRIMKNLSHSLSENCVDFSTDEDEREEMIALTSETMLEMLTETGRIPTEAIQEAVGARKLFPVWFGSALKMEGVDEFLKGLDSVLPENAENEDFGMRVYKIGRDPQGARLTYVKVTGGTLKVKQPITYPVKNAATESELTEKVDQIRLYTGEKFETADEVPAGTVCAVTGLSEIMPGQGAGAEADGEIPVLEAVMTRRILLTDDIDPSSFFRTIRVLEEEDPALHLTWTEERKEIHVQIMGQVQTEILQRLIKDRFGVTVGFGPERIMYKETVVEPVEGVGHFEPLRHYAEAHLYLEPAERGSGITVQSAVSTDTLDLNWQRLILTHVLEREHPGVLTGAPVTDVRVTLVGGRAHLKHTEGGDFRQATYRAIRNGLKKTSTMLLEPWYAFEIEIPEEAYGRTTSALMTRHAVVSDPEYMSEDDGIHVRMTGELPVSECTDLMLTLSSASQGRANLTLTLAGYRECHNAAEMIERIGYDSEADLENPTGSVFCAHGAGFYVPWDQVETYMHIPYCVNAEASESSDYDAEAEGFRSMTRAELAKTAAPDAEGEALLESIYAREFGRTRDGQRIGDDLSRRSWKKSSGPKRVDEVKPKLDKKGNPIYPPKDTREQMLIVDGYNVIYDWEELRDLSKHDIGAARLKLLDILSNYQGFTGVKTIVVFDAYRTDRTPEAMSKYVNLTVVFTKKDETADAWIERTVHDEISKANITVATSDGMEQLTVMRLGALRLSARMLKQEIERVTGESRGVHYT